MCVCVFRRILTIKSSVASLLGCSSAGGGGLSISTTPIFIGTVSVQGGVVMSIKGLSGLEVLGVGNLKGLFCVGFFARDAKIDISDIGNLISVLPHVENCKDSCACCKRKLKFIS